jgi:hypothetical protein
MEQFATSPIRQFCSYISGYPRFLPVTLSSFRVLQQIGVIGFNSQTKEQVKMENCMGTLKGLTAISTDQRRNELAKLLATGLVRILMQRQRGYLVDIENSDENLADGLEDS